MNFNYFLSRVSRHGMQSHIFSRATLRVSAVLATATRLDGWVAVRRKSPFISETAQDRPMTTMER